VSFSDKEMELHGAEEGGLADAAEILKMFRDNLGLQPDGMVEPARFEEIKREVERMKEEFVRLVRGGVVRMRRERGDSGRFRTGSVRGGEML
jgi:hypothetical protein